MESREKMKDQKKKKSKENTIRIYKYKQNVFKLNINKILNIKIFELY